MPRRTSPSRRAVMRRRKPRGAGRRAALVLALLVLAGLGAVAALWWQGRLAGGLRSALRVPGLGAARETVTLYFAHPRWTRLVAESREIPAGLNTVERIQRLVAELARGPSAEGAVAVLPRSARLRGAYLGRDGLVFLDFEGQSLEGFDPGGASGELLTVFALVHTVVENAPGIRRVQILVDGEEKETLAGHVAVGGPLEPQPELMGDDRERR